MQDFLFDVNDILNDKLMPVSLMLFEAGGSSDLRNLTQQALDDDFQCATKDKVSAEDGSLNNAFTSMGYHRQMINKFLCSKFIAEQILDEVQPSRVNHRLGVAKSSPDSEFMAQNSSSHDGGARKSHMLYDEGSNEYKNWLAKWKKCSNSLHSFTEYDFISRTTTLNDVYRNFGASDKKRRRQDQFIDDADEYATDYEEGDVTGFMAQKPLPNSGINSFNVSFQSFLSVAHFKSAANSATRKIKANLLMQFSALFDADSNSWCQDG